MQINKDIKYAVGFSMIDMVGAVRGKRILDHFGSFEPAWRATKLDLQKAGIEENLAQKIVDSRSGIDLDREMEELAREGISVMLFGDEDYPALLRQIPNPPFLIYMRGELTVADQLAVGIVGARKASEYGRSVTTDLAQSLATAGVTVVSGLAAGIDSAAHAATLATAAGRTIAVLGSGVDEATIYPTVNQKLARQIADGRGAVISEYPRKTPPLRQHFPARNRIISGLSLGVVVVEAQITSGSLITAQSAVEQNREVFAVPGNIYNKHAQGPHSLLRQGAKLVEKGEDILEELNLLSASITTQARILLPDSPDEEMLLAVLELEPLHIDTIVERGGLPINKLNVLLVTMEMKGLVKNLGGNTYAKNK